MLQLARCLRVLRAGDTLAVLSLNRPGRSPHLPYNALLVRGGTQSPYLGVVPGCPGLRVHMDLVTV
jgi:hypothetical protein